MEGITLQVALNAESAALGTCLEHPEAWETVLDELRSGDFAEDYVRAAFDYAAKYRAEHNKPPIQAEVRQHSGVTENYLTQCWSVAGTMGELDRNIQCVKDGARLRALREIGQALIDGVDMGGNAAALQADAAERFESLDARAQGELVTPGELFTGFIDELDADRSRVIETFSDIDRILGGGLMPSGFYVLAARPGYGKTALALQIADNAAEKGNAALFVTLEMDACQIHARRMARRTGIPACRMLIERNLNEEEMRAVVGAGQRTEKLPFYLNGRERCTVSDIRGMARRVKDLKLIVIDYLGLIKSEKRFNSRYEEITEISGALKTLARQLKVPVLCLAQLNRASELRNDKTPCMADLRDSGAIEQDADAVILLHRKEGTETAEKNPRRRKIGIEIAKNRHAGTGGVVMWMDLPTGRFTIASSR